MSTDLQVVYLARHGETAWSLTGQHAGLTDLPLTETGERVALRLGERLKGLNPAKVFSRQLQRAFRTCQLAGFGSVVEVDPDLAKWNFGEYEGRRTADIRLERPIGSSFATAARGVNPRGRYPARADCGVTRVRATAGDVLRFSTGRFVRVSAARWIGAEPTLHAAAFMLSMASLSALGYEHDLSRPVIRLWDDTKHVRSGGELKYEGSRALKALG